MRLINQFTCRALLLASMFGCFWSCEEEFKPDIVVDVNDIVVEGYIEASSRNIPPYIILTRNFPFFQELQQDALTDAFVHDAYVEVSGGGEVLVLNEFCLDDLNDTQKGIAAQFLGLDPDSIGFNLCLYTDLSLNLIPREGVTYDLLIKVDGRELRATTAIPPHTGLDTLFFGPPPGVPSDTLLEMEVRVSDPVGIANFYRYMTTEGEGPEVASLTSVFDDRLFDGQSFVFPLPKSEPPNASFDPATFGLFRKDQTYTIKWLNIDEAHFRFWNTLEFNAANQGPFSGYTNIESNIDGGLGVWGGASVSYYEVIATQ